LRKLLQTDLQVVVHLVQPFDDAFTMTEPASQQKWEQFVSHICNEFGRGLFAIEVGSTINRRRWAGYNTKGFFAAWDIAHRIIKSSGITLIGPNISDFEPFYTFSVLEQLAEDGMLPDMHTNNLFCERVTEPERYDHRILGFQWATRLKVNLVKKSTSVAAYRRQPWRQGLNLPRCVLDAATYRTPAGRERTETSRLPDPLYGVTGRIGGTAPGILGTAVVLA
jgi:hypothetical protein